MNTITKSVTIKANTSTLLLEQPLSALLKGQKREEVVVHAELTTTAGLNYQGNSALCLQKDLKLEAVNPEVTVEAAEGGCRVSLKADKFVRALALSLGDADYWFDDNYFDLLPGVATTCFVKTTLSAEEVRERLTINHLNAMNGTK